jgi:hypothetical protein
MIGSRAIAGVAGRWPELPWRDWEPTIATLHMWSQIVGKVRMTLAPPLNHWWHVALYVSARGLTTSPIPYRGRQFQIDFDFKDHELQVTDSNGLRFAMTLGPVSVARFYREFMAGLQGIGIDVRIWTKPVEVADAIPFEADEQHASYDRRHAELFWQALIDADRVLKEFQTGFLGKASPVHFFWGGFDLAATRYSGRRAPLHPGGAPNCAVWVMEEAYSREEISVGWWPTSEGPGPRFYAYAYPEPDGFTSASVGPAEAFYDADLGEFSLPYDSVRLASDPDAALLEFLETAYVAGADLGAWDRSILEPAVQPDRPPRRPWSSVRSDSPLGSGISRADPAPRRGLRGRSSARSSSTDKRDP